MHGVLCVLPLFPFHLKIVSRGVRVNNSVSWLVKCSKWLVAIVEENFRGWTIRLGLIGVAKLFQIHRFCKRWTYLYIFRIIITNLTKFRSKRSWCITIYVIYTLNRITISLILIILRMFLCKFLKELILFNVIICFVIKYEYV